MPFLHCLKSGRIRGRWSRERRAMAIIALVFVDVTAQLVGAASTQRLLEAVERSCRVPSV